MAYQKIKAIGSPEFINVVPQNDAISKCEIKVLYLGKNRNKTYIDKESAITLANSLPGCPIVGYYRDDKEDFRDHGQCITIQDNELEITDKTFPYGYVDPVGKIWFQDFETTDAFGNSIQRTYLMTTGYIWTKQFPQTKSIIEEGKGQSMKLYEDEVDGHWEMDEKGMDYFIINDAKIENLCILGDDVEPCFEEAGISDLDVSLQFSKNNPNFTKTLFSMMQDLTNYLKGEKVMDNEQKLTLEFEEDKKKKEEEVANSEEKEKEKTEEPKEEDEDKKKKEFKKEDEEVNTNKDDEKKKEFKKEDEKEENKPSEDKEDEDKKSSEEDEDKKKKEFKKEDKEDKSSEDNKEESKEDKKEDEDLEKKYSLLVDKFNTLSKNYESLSESLSAFQKSADRTEKENLIKKFYMLSEEDKKDVVENIDTYSLDEIESKLSIIGFRKKVNFNLADFDENENKVEEENITTFSLSSDSSPMPDWVKSVVRTQEKHKN